MDLMTTCAGLRRRGGRPGVLLLLLLVALVPVWAACGVGGGGANTVGFEIAAIGPAGGTIQAGDVKVVIAPGALGETTSVSILPQAAPFPIQPLQGDPCTYAYLGPIWCVGPVGTPMAAAGTITVIYDPALIPQGVDPADLVLMLWDDTLGALVPTTIGITHDVGLAQFVFPAYLELGHVAVGVRTCLPPQTNPGWVIPLRLLSSMQLQLQQVTLPNAGIFLGDADQPTVAPEPRFITDGEVPAFAQPSPDGQSILFGQYQPNESFSLFTLPVAGSDDPALLPTDHDALFGSDSVLGWWLGTGGSNDVFFPEFEDFSQSGKAAAGGSTAATGGGRDGMMINLTPQTGLGPVTTWHQGFPGEYLFDIRQAETGLHALVVWDDYSSEELERIVEIVAADGTLVSRDAIPFGGGLFSPRFVTAGDAVTRVADDARSVIQCDLLGQDEVTLLSLPANDPREIHEFVTDPTSNWFAALVHVPSGNIGETYELWLGSYDGASTTLLDIETLPIATSFVFFHELVWHPTGPYVYLGMNGSTLPIEVAPAAPMGSRILFHPELPISRIGFMDVNLTDGRLLVTIAGSGDRKPALAQGKVGVPGRVAMFDSDGVWVSDPDGDNALLLEEAPGTGIEVPARWLVGWRRAPGTYEGVR